jgi:hypothetical protein
MMVIEMRT